VIKRIRKLSTTRVGVADKSPLVRAALQHLFTNHSRFNPVTVCDDCESSPAPSSASRIDSSAATVRFGTVGATAA
jgi:hypothetical protein